MDDFPADRAAFSRRLARLARAAAAFFALALLAVLLARASEPIGTDDLFWHLALGRRILDERRVFATDTFSHTAAGRPDVPQQWLSEAIYALVERRLGFYGLRVLAGVVLALEFFCAWRAARRSASNATAALAGVALFGLLGYWWLLQLRPHGFSIALFFVFAVALEGRITAARAARLAALCLLWTNLHAVGLLGSIAAAGIALVEAGAALFVRKGVALLPGGPPPEPGRAAALAALLFGLSLATPSGLDLWRFSFLHGEDMRLVVDEWSRLALFRARQDFRAIEGPPHAAALLVLALFSAALVAALATRPGRARALAERRRLALALFGAALALFAVRFLFALVLPFAWAAGELRAAAAERSCPRARALAAAGLAALSGAAFAAYLFVLDGRMFHASSLDEWRRPLLEKKLFPEMTRFLCEASIEGDLFNSYNTGGQLLYALSPRCRVFVDARTAVYGARIITDARRVEIGLGAQEVLDRYGVDVFVGTGFFGIPRMSYGRLDGDPRWVSVFRSQEVDVRLRRGAPRTAANLARIAAYYAREKVPFDAARGFDPAAAFDAAPRFAETMRIIPRELLIPLEPAAPPLARAERAYGLGLAWERLGVLDRAADRYAEAAALAPGEPAPRVALEAVRARIEGR